jgi:putative colanic acid biosynthesis UDP-glucose lipid carrier transferase
MKTKNLSTDMIRLILYLVDFICLNISYVIVYCIFFNSFDVVFYELKNLVYTNLLWVILSKIYKPYNLKRFQTSDKMLSKSFKLMIIFLVIKFLNYFLLRHEEDKHFSLFISQLTIFFILVSILRISLIYLIKKLRKKGVNNKNVLIIGITEESRKIIETFNTDNSLGYKVIGYIDDKKRDDLDRIQYLGSISNLQNVINTYKIDEVYKSITDENINTKQIITTCEDNFVRIKLIPNFQKHTLNRKISTDFYIDQPIIHLRKEPLEFSINKIQKRIFDIIFSSILILSIYPWLFPLVFVIQKMTSKGPLFFIQKRTGQDNKVFDCIKFRTMYLNNDSEIKGTLKNDPRITPFGKFLRKTRIDELPQFINVFLGQMSVVGPRPHMVKHTEEYSKLVDEFLVRHFVKPGITGWAQTTGYIDETRKLQEMKDKVKKDVWYIENWSFLLDIKIIILTIINIIRKDKNAY